MSATVTSVVFLRRARDADRGVRSPIGGSRRHSTDGFAVGRDGRRFDVTSHPPPMGDAAGAPAGRRQKGTRVNRRERIGKIEKLRSAIVIASVAAVAALVGLAWIAFRVHSVMYGSGGLLHTILITAYGVLVLIYLPTRIILYILYRPFPTGAIARPSRW